MSIRNSIERILNEWPIESQKPFKDNALANFIRTDLVEEVHSVFKKENPSLLLKASAGAGNWASVPWLAILDPSITTTTQGGIYPVYLFRADGSGVYLSLGQGTTDPARELGKISSEKRARSIAADLRDKIPALQQWDGEGTDLRSNTPLGKSYETPNIGARLYEKDALPTEEVFRKDLLGILAIYREVAQKEWPRLETINESSDSEDEYSLGMGTNTAQAFRTALNGCGLVFAANLPLSLIAAMQSKRFLLLTGLSGSGKTQLAQAFSKWICAFEKQRAVVAVGADWTSNENLLGYPDALNPGHYRKPDNGALDLILRAQVDPEHPYFLILDEMNLSHVERYFSDFLSSMESGEPISLHDGDENELWPSEKDGAPIVPGKLRIPKNLFVIGTVNVDETTYMFSPKVLDRANVIEFRVSKNEMETFLNNPVKPNLDAIAGQGAKYGKVFVAAAKQKDVPLDDTTRVTVSKVLMEFFPQLKEAGAEFGYRTAHEICRFVYFHKKLSDEEKWSIDSAMDAAIMQKLLPKLHGSKKKLGPVLAALIRLCLKEDARPENDPIKDEVLVAENAIYPNSLEKLARMRKRLAEHGFTSFAEA